LLLKRDPVDKKLIRTISVDEAMRYLEENDFCNPHQLVRNERKRKLRTHFFERLLAKVDIHMVNTVLPPEETQCEIRRILAS
ncbi:MAG TPA: hypothetical protein VMS79_02260, partial [Methanomassiliicoccales archaeon]|nr:hypothetical protein [Methanomassiliicoccales archaeon]